MISSTGWNDGVERAGSGFLPVGKQREYGLGGNLPQGRIPTRDKTKKWRHPWHVLPVWNENIALYDSERESRGRLKGAWQLYINPGFLNGHPPSILMRGGDITPGAQVFANDYTGDELVNAPSIRHDVLLTDPYRPFIKVMNMMDTRSKWVGPDGKTIKGGEVPFFMRARGAYKPYPLDFGDFLQNLLAGSDQEAVTRYLFRLLNAEAPSFVIRDSAKDNLPEGTRLCYQCDIVLKVARPAVKQIIEPAGTIGFMRYAGFTITMPDRLKYGASIYHIEIFIQAPHPDYRDVLSGDYIEYPYDELVLGRFFLLSPDEKYRDGHGVPDGTWTPFVRHEVFWNLNYSSITQLDDFNHDTSLEWFKQILGVLAGGVAYLFAVSVVDPIEATYDTLMTAYNQTAVKGMFWTG